MLTDRQIREIRSRFKIFQSRIYLNTCSQGALSDAVEAGFDDYIASWHEAKKRDQKTRERRAASVSRRGRTWCSW